MCKLKSRFLKFQHRYYCEYKIHDVLVSSLLSNSYVLLLAISIQNSSILCQYVNPPCAFLGFSI